jgi:glycosyltransferase involved in cell wall biosynthesis
MNISHLNIGILHSLIGKNDGVSIVIDQTVDSMVKDFGVPLGKIFFLAAHSSPRFNAQTDDIFWHKNETHKTILNNFNKKPPFGLDELIHNKALYAKRVIRDFLRENQIDLLIAHNTSHPYNFITAVGLGYLIEESRQKGYIWPKVMVWWHDSYFERTIFENPNDIIKKYLKYLPGTYIDGIAFINHQQVDLARRLFEQYNAEKLDIFFRDRTTVVPNTSDIPWDWTSQDWQGQGLIYPTQDNYNDSFLYDVGFEHEIEKRGFSRKETALLLQHTRVVPRKKIETAIEFAFLLDRKFVAEGVKKCVVLLVSGHSGDEQNEYKKFLLEYFDQRIREHPEANVVLLFGEDIILSHRDIIIDKKYYKFSEIPSIIAANGGMGTYFSDVEGFGNNLLEMISSGLPVVINKYEIYKQEIEHLGFDLPAVEDQVLTDEVVNRAFHILTDIRERNRTVRNNLEVLDEKLDHRIIAQKLDPLIRNMFTKKL